MPAEKRLSSARLKGRPEVEDKTVNQVGVRLKEQDNKTMLRLKKLFHSTTETAVFTTLLSTLAERSEDDILDFLFKSKPMGEDGFSLPLIGRSPCGEWRGCASNETSRQVNIGLDVANRLGLRVGDFLIESDGESMRSHHPERDIPSGTWLAMRPGRASQGEVCLFEARLNNGECRWTIKRHSAERNGKSEPSRITDGMGEDFSLPDGTEEVVIRGVKVAMICPS